MLFISAAVMLCTLAIQYSDIQTQGQGCEWKIKWPVLKAKNKIFGRVGAAFWSQVLLHLWDVCLEAISPLHHILRHAEKVSAD